MIQPQELRIGNLVYFKSEIEGVDNIYYIATIKQIMDNGVYLDGFNPMNKDSTINGFASFKQIIPIPLTQELLLDFGLKKISEDKFNLFNHPTEVEIVIKCNSYSRNFQCDGIIFALNNLDYAHQLQNLYFALKGEELQFKQTT